MHLRDLKREVVLRRNRIYLVSFLREENTTAGLGRWDNLLDQYAVKCRNQTLRHFFFGGEYRD